MEALPGGWCGPSGTGPSESSGWAADTIFPASTPSTSTRAVRGAGARAAGRPCGTLRSGLPQRPAYHLIYRHGLEVAPDSRTLAMGSTTGALWLSRDAGDSWTAVSRDLPPVYCVRFG